MYRRTLRYPISIQSHCPVLTLKAKQRGTANWSAVDDFHATRAMLQSNFSVLAEGETAATTTSSSTDDTPLPHDSFISIEESRLRCGPLHRIPSSPLFPVNHMMSQWAPLLQESISFTLGHMRCVEDTSVDVLLVDAPTMRALNKRTSQKDKATDVLSFPSGVAAREMMSTVISTPTIDDADDAMLDHDLGSMVVCPEYVLHQYRRRRHSVSTFEDRVAVMTIHATLHLLGYTHDGDEDFVVMSRHEKNIFEARRLRRRRALNGV
eukprot:PhM_4_TR10158/c0_g1_i1/m.7800/K07042/ybeY, yqfG; probable rRNA maturation factor